MRIETRSESEQNKGIRVEVRTRIADITVYAVAAGAIRISVEARLDDAPAEALAEVSKLSSSAARLARVALDAACEPAPKAEPAKASFELWLEQNCVREAEARTACWDLHRDYAAFCEVNGYAPLSFFGFRTRLVDHGFPIAGKMRRLGVVVACRKGIALRSEILGEAQLAAVR